MAVASTVKMPDNTKLKSFFRWFSAEPAVLFFSLATFLDFAATPNLIQQKVCSPEAPPSVEFVCNNTDLLAQATDIITIRAALKEAFASIILLPATFWRDLTGLNKITIYFALFWEIVGTCIQMYAYLNWTSSVWITSIAEGIIRGLGGSSSLFYVGATCAVTDNSRVEERTIRLTFIPAETTVGSCLAYATIGYCLTFMGYTWFLIFTISLLLTSGILIMIFVKENKTKEKKTLGQSFKRLKSLFKRRRNTTVVWLMVFASCLITVVTQAEANLFQYYLQQAFGYSIAEAGLYICYRLMVIAIGSVIVSFLLTNLLKWSDFKIGILCSLLTIISSISMLFAVTTLELNTFALLDISRMVLCGIPKSIISKCVNENEMGMFFSFCYIGDSLILLLIYYLYGYIYTATFTTLPGAFFLASAAIITVSLIIYSISSFMYTPIETCDKQAENNQEDQEVCEQVPQLSETSNL